MSYPPDRFNSERSGCHRGTSPRAAYYWCRQRGNEQQMSTKQTPTVVSLFSGAGGLDLGLEAAGMHTLYASDIDYHSCKTLESGRRNSRANDLPFLRDAIIEQADVSDLDGSQILAQVGLARGKLDVLAGGPPCQAFSVMGRRQGRGDPRGQLPDQYARLLAQMAPRSFVFENVYGLLTIDGGNVFHSICKLLENPAPDLSYKLSVFRLNAEDYGVPQRRDRVIIIGSREGRQIEEIRRITGDQDGGLHRRNVRDALRGLPPMGESLPNHTGRKHSDRIIERYRSLAFGERDPKTRINRLDPERPSYAIIVGSDKGGGKGHVHPHDPREVTPRESARIQTFPDWWEFSGTSRHPIRQVGNAVPPLLGACIGAEMVVRLFDSPRPDYFDMVRLLGQDHLFDSEMVFQ